MSRKERARARPRLLTGPFLLITTASFFYFLGFGATFPVLPLFVKRELAAGDVAVGVAVGTFSFVAVMLRPLVGAIGDRRGRRMLIIVGSFLVGTSFGGYAVVSSLLLLIAVRLVTGVGEAMFFVSATSAINDLAPDERRGEAVSLFTLSLYGGLALGPVLGEAVLGEDRFDLVWITAGALILVATVLGWRAPETKVPEGSPSSLSLGTLYHRAAIVPGFALLASVWGFAGFSAFVALYARELGLRRSGLVFFTYAAIVVCIRSVGARIPDLLGPGRTARFGFAMSSIGLATMGGWRTVAGLFVGTVVFSCGQALGFPALMTLAIAGAPASERGAVVGTFTAFFDLAYGVGAVTLGVVADVLGYRGTFLAASAVAAAGLVLLVKMIRIPDRAARVPGPPEPI